MARFFLHLRNSNGHLEDEEGQELADIDAARQAAIASVRSIVSEEAETGFIDLRAPIPVFDENGALLLELPFSEAVEVTSELAAVSEPEGGKG